jgi:hypothetical protein
MATRRNNDTSTLGLILAFCASCVIEREEGRGEGRKGECADLSLRFSSVAIEIDRVHQRREIEFMCVREREGVAVTVA